MEECSQEQKSRLFLMAGGFIIMGMSSLIHAFIHAADLDLNLLYQTLVSYCFGLLILTIAISSSRPQKKTWLLLLYLPLFVLLVPEVYKTFPLFGIFRPLVWISIAFLAGHVCILHVAAYYRIKQKSLFFAATGYLFICISAIFLFFPAPIGSSTWLHGHLFRPIGFMMLFICINKAMYSQMGGSIIYRILTSFSLLTAIPMIIFGTIVFYINLNSIDIEEQRLLIFLLMLAIFTSVLIFGLGTIIKLIHPILRLKESVDKLVDEGLNKYIDVESSDEIGELSNAFNEMVVKLSYAVEEQERLCRLAATGELAATLAHEIKNPLNAISGAANYIGKNYDGILISEFTRIISDEVARINKLTGTLLGFAKPVQLEKAPSDIARLIREIGALLSQEAEEQHIDLQFAIAENIPEIFCDYSQIKQVLINLIINGFDAITGEGAVTVAARYSDGNVIISVSDTGPGIAPEDLRQIFNPFYTTKTRGTGLGLAISQKIARWHNGDLVVESTPGKGCIFTLILPQGESLTDELHDSCC
ncbi:MAG: ATP-binding protein [Desulfobulbaceae bacterium]|nr:ATP-binding protein [Desulfobulbaceae bacterium]